MLVLLLSKNLQEVLVHHVPIVTHWENHWDGKIGSYDGRQLTIQTWVVGDGLEMFSVFGCCGHVVMVLVGVEIPKSVIPSYCRLFVFDIVCILTFMHWTHIDRNLAHLDITCEPIVAVALHLEGANFWTREHGLCWHCSLCC